MRKTADSSYLSSSLGPHACLYMQMKKHPPAQITACRERFRISLATPGLRLVKTDTYWLVWATDEFRADREKRKKKLLPTRHRSSCVLLFYTNSSLTDHFSSLQQWVSRRHKKEEKKKTVKGIHHPTLGFNMMHVLLQWDSNQIRERKKTWNKNYRLEKAQISLYRNLHNQSSSQPQL